MSNSFGFHEFVTLAAKMPVVKESGKHSENILRLIANRVYYGAFHGTKQYLNDCEMAGISNDGVTHDDVWGEFNSKKGQGAYRKWRLTALSAAKKLKEFREWADYNNPNRLIPSNADEIWAEFQVLQEAIQALKEIRQCKSNLWMLELKCPEPNPEKLTE